MADYIISQITLADGKTVEIKDAVARAAVVGGTYFLGVTTTAITDGSTVTTVMIGETSVNVVNGNMVAYGNKEFVYADADSKWHELGDLTNLGDLALKDDVSATYTPAGTIEFSGSSLTSTGSFTPEGTVTKPDITVTPATATIAEFATAGSVSAGSAASMVLPAWNATVSNESLVFSWNAGSFTANVPTAVTLPTSKDTSVMTGATAALDSAPTFSGAAGSVSVSGTPAGTATFSGTEATIVSA